MRFKGWRCQNVIPSRKSGTERASCREKGDDERNVRSLRIDWAADLQEPLPDEWMNLRLPTYYAEQKIDLVLNSRVSSIDAWQKQVQLENGKTYRFSALLLATGSDVIKLPIPGARDSDVFYVRTGRMRAACSRGSQPPSKSWSWVGALSVWRLPPRFVREASMFTLSLRASRSSAAWVRRWAVSTERSTNPMVLFFMWATPSRAWTEIKWY